MRKILFRAKRIDNGGWVFGDLLSNSDNYICGGFTHVILSNNLYYGVIPETVCEFTGKRDYYKFMIFEGDIVRAKKEFYSTDIAVVKWLIDRCAFFYVANTAGTDIINRDPFQSAYKINSLSVEIIGNIYDNPNLIPSL